MPPTTAQPKPESSLSTILNLDLQVLLTRVVKYFVEGFAVAIAAYYIPGRVIKLDEVLLIGLVGTATFAIMDMYLPTYAVNTKMGVGFGIGANLVGFGL